MNGYSREDGSEDLIAGLQDQVQELEAQLAEAELREDELRGSIADLEDQLAAADAADEAPVGDQGLQALASTVRTALRSGHPDAQTHLDSLLNALGAR